jgi:hypothetical protein
MLEDMQQRYPAKHYIMVDDKLRILTAMKQIMGAKLTTIFPRQGHYALDATSIANYPPADLTIECIGHLTRYDLTVISGKS